MMIGDGVVPSNEGRGYVLRRFCGGPCVMPGSSRPKDLITPHLVEATIDTLGDGLSGTGRQRGHDLVRGGAGRGAVPSDPRVGSSTARRRTRRDGAALPGSVAFRLHDTFGFPIELTTEIANERGVEIDRAGFDEEMEASAARARKAWRGGDAAVAGQLYGRVIDETGPTSSPDTRPRRDRSDPGDHA